MSDKVMYGLKEAAEQISISQTTLEQLIAQGDVRIRRIGKRRLVPHSELVRLSTRDVQVHWPDKSQAQAKDAA